jgi:hypothetical protein
MKAEGHQSQSATTQYIYRIYSTNYPVPYANITLTGIYTHTLRDGTTVATWQLCIKNKFKKIILASKRLEILCVLDCNLLSDFHR